MTRLKTKKRKRSFKTVKETIYYKTLKIHKLSNQIVHSKNEIEIKKVRSTIKRLFREIHKLKDSTSTTDQSLTGTI